MGRKKRISASIEKIIFLLRKIAQFSSLCSNSVTVQWVHVKAALRTPTHLTHWRCTVGQCKFRFLSLGSFAPFLFWNSHMCPGGFLTTLATSAFWSTSLKRCQEEKSCRQRTKIHYGLLIILRTSLWMHSEALRSRMHWTTSISVQVLNK